MNDAWRTFTEHDRRLQAPPHLEARVLAAVTSVPAPAVRRRRAPYTLMAIAAAAIVAFVIMPSDKSPEPRLLESRAFRPTMLAASIDAQPPERRTLPTVRRPVEPRSLMRPEGPPVVVMVFEAGPPRSEALQRVRVRVPRETLQQLGVALIEPDAGGMVDLEMLVGEDGLPRDIRTIRFEQEEQ